jgi:hypothetical protein
MLPVRTPFFLFPRDRGKKEMGVNSLPFSFPVGARKLMNHFVVSLFVAVKHVRP